MSVKHVILANNAMMAKPIKTLKFHFAMIQFSIITIMQLNAFNILLFFKAPHYTTNVYVFE